MLIVSNALSLQELLEGGVLVLCRLSGVIAFAPPFRGSGIPTSVKTALVIALTWLVTPTAVLGVHGQLELTGITVAGELTRGLLLGLVVSLLTESLLFAGTLMSASFSFSLANLLDPNSQVETDVLSTALNWIGLLVIFAAGLHRTLLLAMIRSFHALPLGSIAVSGTSAAMLVNAASGLFFAGMQLASPVLAAALLVEVAVGLVGRIAPGLPVQMLNVPLKTVVAYVVLIGSLAIWPGWIEHHFTSLLDVAQRAARL